MFLTHFPLSGPYDLNQTLKKQQKLLFGVTIIEWLLTWLISTLEYKVVLDGFSIAGYNIFIQLAAKNMTR